VSERLIFGSHAGGQGDHLLWSAFPEIWTRMGYDVYMTNQQPPYRSQENYNLIWGHNPYMLGTVSEPATHGEPLLKSFVHGPKLNNPMHQLAITQGVNPYEINPYPKIYYPPKWLPEWRGKIVADPTSISQAFPPPVFDAWIEYLAWNFKFDPSKIIVLTSSADGPHGHGAMAGCERYQVRDLYEKVDILNSCAMILTADSGTNSLGSAIKQNRPWPDVLCLTTTMAYKDFIFSWPNVTYFPSDGLTPNYRYWYREEAK
jgi:hypothetical protein